MAENYNTNKYTIIDKDGEIRRYETSEAAMEAYNEREKEWNTENQPAYIMSSQDMYNVCKKKEDDGLTHGLVVGGVSLLLTAGLKKIIDHFWG